MARWTVRVPDDVAEDFREFCRVQGMSIQAALEAAARNSVATFQAQGRVPVGQWFPNSPEARREWMGYVQLARQLDAQKRARG